MTLSRRAALEAILFVTESPVPPGELAEVLEVSEDEVAKLLVGLENDMVERGSGLTLRRSAGGWRIYSHPDAYHYLERFSMSASARKISPAALEVLSVIAYEQPVSRAQINEIRGVDSDSAVRTLERLGLVIETDRLPLPGNPAVYETTALFMEKVGISSLDELPPLADHVPPSDVVGVLEETFRNPSD